jgi:hypothetical protein
VPNAAGSIPSHTTGSLFPFTFEYVILMPLLNHWTVFISHVSGFVLRAHIMGEGQAEGDGG